MRKVLDAFMRGQSHNEETCSTDGTTVYSYAMPIARRLADGGYWVASQERSPSKTTTTQIHACMVALRHVWCEVCGPSFSGTHSWYCKKSEDAHT